MKDLPNTEPVTGESSSAVDWQRTLAELRQAVRAVDPAAFLILPRILRRVIKQDCRLTGFGLKVPHRKSYVIGREALLESVDRDELGLDDDAELAETVVLLAQPTPRRLAAEPFDAILLRCWRLLFHARVHVALAEQTATGRLSASTVRRRIQQIGSAEFDEIRTVLGQDELLLPPHDDASIYTEFVAVYLELRYFAASFVSRYFSGLENLAAADSVIRQDVDADRLFLATRPRGAPEPTDECELAEFVDLPIEAEARIVEPAVEAEHPSETKYRFLMRKSQRPASLGNVVRAAIYRARAERFAPPAFVGRVRSAIKMDVYRLIRRLQAALELDDASPQPWQDSLFALVSQTPRGIWTAEARLLYDLQKVCVDHERGLYTVDLVEWALSRGRRPIKRPLPNQRDVLMLKHLRSAAQRLAVVRLSDAQRGQLAMLVREASQRVEARLRRQLRPQIVAALDKVGLAPRNLPERVARKKLVEELLDQIEERGFLTMGDLRDAISRNKLKLPDLSEPLDFLRSDRLLRADRQLATVLDGVYRRGPFYLRWMQRLSSLAFATETGRFVTRFVAVPFGGAYVALGGVHHVWELIAGEKVARQGLHFTSPPIVLALGLFLLCLINFTAFQLAVVRLFKTSYRVFRAAVVEPIRWFVQWPLLQRMLHSRLFIISFRIVIKPLIWTCVVWQFLPEGQTNWRTSTGTAVSIFLGINLLLNSRVGRNTEEVIADWIVQSWHRFGLRFITGLFWLVVDLFRGLLQAIERLMYSVDEWLRFQSGEGSLKLAAKAGIGFLWFFVSYVLRFCVNVLIEPQINPIKHFPVVTVSHKLLLGLIPHFTVVLVGLGMEKALAGLTAGAIITSIPGLFGFLVWELKENWRLYEANRRKNLYPVLIGEHGETMARFLMPGFHSGTLPKRYAKLRRAERRARGGGSWRAVRKHMRALHRIETSIRRYVEREFIELLAESERWQAPTMTLERVGLGSNSVRLVIGCGEMPRPPLQIALQIESGWLVAGVTQPGWADELLSEQRELLAMAMIGLYKSAGIELVRQQIEDQFPPPAPSYDIAAAGLVLWPNGTWDVEVFYDLHTESWIAPRSVRGLAQRRLPTLERRQLVFSDVAVPWSDWMAIWDQGSAGQVSRRASVVPIRVLPS